LGFSQRTVQGGLIKKRTNRSNGNHAVQLALNAGKKAAGFSEKGGAADEKGDISMRGRNATPPVQTLSPEMPSLRMRE
jgi:hypothetical protein